MSLLDCTLTFEGQDKDGEPTHICRHGINPSRAEIVSRTPARDEGTEYIAVKFPSGKVWTGIGRPHRYYPASITVYRLRKKAKDGSYQAVAILDWDLGRKPRQP